MEIFLVVFLFAIFTLVSLSPFVVLGWMLVNMYKTDFYSVKEKP